MTSARVNRGFQSGYEKRSPDGSAIQSARAEFLSELSWERPAVIRSLFDDCRPIHTDLLRRKEPLLEKLVAARISQQESIPRQPKFLRSYALRTLFPDYVGMLPIDGSEDLVAALENWARVNHLECDWCLNAALEFLNEFEVTDDKSLAFRLLSDGDDSLLHHCIAAAWSTVVLKTRTYASYRQYQSNQTIEEAGVFAFLFKYGEIDFYVIGPFGKKNWSEFYTEVELAFKRAKDKPRGARKQLDAQLRRYRDDVNRVAKQLDLQPPRRAWSKSDHVKWLIDYQVPPCRSYREVARLVRRDESTIREAIGNLSRLIGLTLRRSEIGRKKGIVEMRPRRNRSVKL